MDHTQASIGDFLRASDSRRLASVVALATAGRRRLASSLQAAGSARSLRVLLLQGHLLLVLESLLVLQQLSPLLLAELGLAWRITHQVLMIDSLHVRVIRLTVADLAHDVVVHALVLGVTGVHACSGHAIGHLHVVRCVRVALVLYLSVSELLLLGGGPLHHLLLLG